MNLSTQMGPVNGWWTRIFRCERAFREKGVKALDVL
jgi:hypothetical protein